VPSKILAQAGISLADVYDVQGSIAGVERLLSEEVQVVHEMGGTLFSERFSGSVRSFNTGNIGQNVTFGVVLSDLPAGPWKINALHVVTDNLVRVDQTTVLVRSPSNNREVVLFAWDTAVDGGVSVRVDGDAGVEALTYLRPSQPAIIPGALLAVGAGQPQDVSGMALRGVTAAFGAGTVAVTCTFFISFAEIGGVSSLGLPLPGW